MCFTRQYMYGMGYFIKNAKSKKHPNGCFLRTSIELELADLKILKAALELTKLTTGVHQTMYTCPCWMGLGINIERQLVTFAAIGGAGHKFGAIGHDDLDRVIMGMNIGFHGSVL